MKGENSEKILAAPEGKNAILNGAMNPHQDSPSPSENGGLEAPRHALIATFAHDLRSPLSSILTGIEVMKLSANDPQQAEKVLGMIERQAHEITRLVDDLVETSRTAAK